MKSRHFHGSMPHIIDDIVKEALNFNNNNPRNFSRSQRCITYALDGSRLIAIGYNQMKTHPFTKMYHDVLKNSIHAEADMLMNVMKMKMIDRITDIVVIRGTIKPLNSFPCDICYGLLNMYFNKVRMWFYSCDSKSWEMKII